MRLEFCSLAFYFIEVNAFYFSFFFGQVIKTQYIQIESGLKM